MDASGVNEGSVDVSGLVVGGGGECDDVDTQHGPERWAWEWL